MRRIAQRLGELMAATDGNSSMCGISDAVQPLEVTVDRVRLIEKIAEDQHSRGPDTAAIQGFASSNPRAIFWDNRLAIIELDREREPADVGSPPGGCVSSTTERSTGTSSSETNCEHSGTASSPRAIPR